MNEQAWLTLIGGIAANLLVAAFAWGGFWATTRLRIKTLEEAFRTLAAADRRMLGQLTEHALRLLRVEIELGITEHTHRRTGDQPPDEEQQHSRKDDEG